MALVAEEVTGLRRIIEKKRGGWKLPAGFAGVCRQTVVEVVVDALGRSGASWRYGDDRQEVGITRAWSRR